MAKLFRQEVIEYQKNKLNEGEVALPNTFSLKILVIVLLFLFTGIVSFLVYGSYTERRTVNGYVTPVNGIIKVVAPNTGVITSIEVSNNEEITSGQELFTIINENYSDEGSYNSQFRKNLNEQLLLIERDIYLAESNYQTDKALLRSELDKLNREKDTNDQLIDNLKKQLSLLSYTYNQYTLINSNVDGAISQRELNDSYSKVLSAEGELYRLKQTRDAINNQIARNLLEYPRIDTNREKEINELKYRETSISKSLLDIEQNAIEVIKSTKSGKVTAFNVHEGQPVNISQKIMSIIPSDDSLKVNILIPPSDIGFINIGNDVHLRYDSFPYQKYGQAKGRISSLSKTTMRPSDLLDIGGFDLPFNQDSSFYLADVEIENPYIMVEGEKRPLNTGMTLTADIKLDNRSLYEWILEPLISLKKRN